MNFLRSKAEQLADYLRGCIARGELSEPLPGTRAWSRQLGVSRPTLDKALGSLSREGLLAVESNRGFRLATPRGSRHLQDAQRVVRVIYYGRDYPDCQADFEWMLALSARLHAHGIHLVIERCNEVRLKALTHAQRGEMFVLGSLPARYQTLFEKAKQPALLIGEPAAGVRLPFVSVDLDGLMRHATQTVLRRGFSHVTLIMPRTKSPGLERARELFEAACVKWPHQPVRRDVVRLPLEMSSMVTAASRFANTVRDRRGIILFNNIPMGLVMTALASHGVAIPKQVELIPIEPSSESLKVCPQPSYYPFPTAGVVQTLTNATLRYFETGIVPLIRKRIRVGMVASGEV